MELTQLSALNGALGMAFPVIVEGYQMLTGNATRSLSMEVIDKTEIEKGARITIDLIVGDEGEVLV